MGCFDQRNITLLGSFRYLASAILVTVVLCLLAQVAQAANETHAQAQLEALLKDRPKIVPPLEHRPDVRDHYRLL
jgi:hypothetical protein